MILGNTAQRAKTFAYGAVTSYGPAFHPGSADLRLSNSVTAPTHRPAGPTTPLQQRRRAIALQRFGLDPVSLAATQGIAVAFSSSEYLDVSVPPVPSTGPMCSDRSDWA